MQALACSATFNEKNNELLNGFLRRSKTAALPEHISIADMGVLQNSIEHWALLSERRSKADTLRALIHALDSATADASKKMLIFTAPAQEVEILAQKLQYKKIDAVPLYGKLDGSERKQIIARFRSGKTRILITLCRCSFQRIPMSLYTAPAVPEGRGRKVLTSLSAMNTSCAFCKVLKKNWV